MARVSIDHENELTGHKVRFDFDTENPETIKVSLDAMTCQFELSAVELLGMAKMLAHFLPDELPAGLGRYTDNII